MARLCPSLPPRAALTLGDRAELDLLNTLERGLSSAYTLFHSVDLTLVAGDQERHGEIDIVVLNQAGDLLLLEVKSGYVEIGADGSPLPPQFVPVGPAGREACTGTHTVLGPPMVTMTRTPQRSGCRDSRTQAGRKLDAARAVHVGVNNLGT